MKKNYLLLLCLSAFMLRAQLNHNFSFPLGGTTADDNKKVRYDGTGNLYVIGIFTGTMDLDPSANTNTISSAGGDDIYVAKYSTTGSFLWGFRLGNASGVNRVNDLAIGNNNEIVVVGTFGGSAVDFDPGPGVTTLTTSSNGLLNSYIAKYSASGTLLNLAQISSSTAVNEITSVTLDGSNNIYVRGYYTGVTDFDPSPATYTLNSTCSMFFAKYSSSLSFNYVKSLDNVSNNTSLYFNDIAVNASGEVILAGSFSSNNLDLDPGPGTFTLTSSPTVYAGFVAKFDNSGNFLFGFKLSGTTQEALKSVAVDASGNTYIGGFFYSTVDFDPSPATYNITMTPSGGPDAFLAKYSSSGSLIWAFKIGGSALDDVTELKIDNNYLYACGTNGTNTDFEPSAATYSTNVGGSFIAKYDLNGALFSATSLSVTTVNSIDVLSQKIAIGGYFATSVDMDPTATTSPITSSGGNDGYLAEYTWSCSNPATPINVTSPASPTICQGSGINLLAAGSGTIDWYSTATATTSIGTGTAYNTGTSLTQGTYTFYAEAKTCTTSINRVPVNVSVVTLPNLSVSASNSLICVGQSATLSASGANSYTWSTGSTNTLVSVSPTTTTTYTLVGNNSNNCSNTYSYTLNVSNCTFINESPSGENTLSFQNPNNGSFEIKGTKHITLVILNQLGQKILTTELNENNNYSVNIQGLSAGLYILNSTSFSKRLIVTN